ncbi:hypothetical protein MR988_08170 [bacterium]|nr:hypothetical protein [bacterium]
MKHKRISRKALSLVLALVLSLSMIAVGSFTVSATITQWNVVGYQQDNSSMTWDYSSSAKFTGSTGSVTIDCNGSNDIYFKLVATEGSNKYLVTAQGTTSPVTLSKGVTSSALDWNYTSDTNFQSTKNSSDTNVELKYTPSSGATKVTFTITSDGSSNYVTVTEGSEPTSNYYIWHNLGTDGPSGFTKTALDSSYQYSYTHNIDGWFYFNINTDSSSGKTNNWSSKDQAANDLSIDSNVQCWDPAKEGKENNGTYYLGINLKTNQEITVTYNPDTKGVTVSLTGSTPTQPTTAQPTTAQPTTAQPTTLQPTTAQPTTVAPTSEPSTTRPGGTELNDVNIYFKGTTLTYLKPAMTLTDSSGTSTPYTMTKASYIGTYITGTYKFYWYKATIPTVTVGDSYKITFKTAGSNMEASMNLDFSSCPTDNNMYFGVDNLQIGTKLVDLSNNETAKLCFRSSANMFTNVAGEPYDPTLTLATVNVSAVSGGETVSYELGDSDMNRSLNILDATKTQMILTYADGINSTEKLLADFNVSGSADIKDVSCLQMYLAKI